MIDIRETFNAACDGSTVDTTAFHTALDLAKQTGHQVYVPAWSVVDAGYIQTGYTDDIGLRGHGATKEGGVKGSRIIMAGTSSDAFFSQENRAKIDVADMSFGVTDFVQDRAFFRFNEGGAYHRFDNVAFEGVEMPIVYDGGAVWNDGCYFQSASYRDVQFRNSGTLHSRKAGLAGTLLRLDNVNHEGGVPENADKILCDLHNIRHIAGTNVLLEGTLSQDDWTIIRLGDTHDGAWVRNTAAVFDNFWSEFQGAYQPKYTVDQPYGRVFWRNPRFGLSTDGPHYRLGDLAVAHIEGESFTGSWDAVQTMFELGEHAIVSISNSSARSIDFAADGFVLEGINKVGSSDTVDVQGSIHAGNTACRELWRFDGGFPDPGLVEIAHYSGCVSYPSADPTWGRKLVLERSVSNRVNWHARIRPRGAFREGMQLWVSLLMKLPDDMGDATVQVRHLENTTNIANLASYGPARQGETVRLLAPIMVTDANVPCGVQVATISDTMAGDIEIAAIAILAGYNAPKWEMPQYPARVQTYAASAPTKGDWTRGDYVANAAPASGQPRGWFCVADGAAPANFTPDVLIP